MRRRRHHIAPFDRAEPATQAQATTGYRKEWWLGPLPDACACPLSAEFEPASSGFGTGATLWSRLFIRQ